MSSVIKTGRPRADVRISSPSAVAFEDLQAPPEPVPEPAGVEPTPEEIGARIIGAAESRAAGIVAAAETLAQQIKQAARDTGFARGNEDAASRWAERFRELEEQAAGLQRQYDGLIESVEPELVDLSVEIARKLLKRELEQSPDAVLGVVRGALQRVKDKAIRLRIHPDDLDVVRDARHTFAEIASGAAEMEIVTDRRVGPGGCILETHGGDLDARLETQLDQAHDLMAREFAEGRRHGDS